MGDKGERKLAGHAIRGPSATAPEQRGSTLLAIHRYEHASQESGALKESTRAKVIHAS